MSKKIILDLIVLSVDHVILMVASVVRMELQEQVVYVNLGIVENYVICKLQDHLLL